MSYDPDFSHPVLGKLDKIYSKSSEVIGQIAASVSKSGDHDDAATHLANVREAYHLVEQHYKRTTKSISKEAKKVSPPSSSIDKLKLEGRDDFERFRDDIVILLNEKENEARKRLKVKKGKRPEKGKRWRSEFDENLIDESLVDEKKLLDEEKLFDEKRLLDEELLSSWWLSGL
ncbi:hypothetical protein LQW54_004129 [Pestalotiopsis sp. IQ-011]